GKLLSSVGSVIGIYIPFILLVGLGLWWTFTHGNVNLGTLNWHTAIPNLHSVSKLSFFAGIIFIFAGLEISAVHANEIDNPKKNYPIAVFISIGCMIIFNLVAGLTEANAIPADQIQLATIIQPFALYFNQIGLPWATNVVAAMIAIGVLAQLSAWVLGPSKAMIKVAEEGNLPKFFQKRNSDDVPVTFVFIQAIVISLVALLYVVVPAINTGFFMILILTTVLYCIVYLFIITSGLVLKYKHPEVKRAFTVPGGNTGMWIVSLLAFVGVLLTIGVSFIPSDAIPASAHSAYEIFLILGTLICFITPLIIFKFKKPSWVKLKKEATDNASLNSNLNNLKHAHINK
ncbi:MAG: APC family permease, partial [Sarcina sp.]